MRPRHIRNEILSDVRAEGRPAGGRSVEYQERLADEAGLEQRMEQALVRFARLRSHVLQGSEHRGQGNNGRCNRSQHGHRCRADSGCSKLWISDGGMLQ